MTATASMVDVAFGLEGDFLPRDHRRALALALERTLPWLAATPQAGVHRLNVSTGGGPQALLSRRTRLMLRVPRGRVDDARALVGVELAVGDRHLRLGSMQVRELAPWGTLYAHFVAAADDGDEAAFLRTVAGELAALGVSSRAICGRHQELEAGSLHGYGLMLDSLSAQGALCILDHGIGAHRRLGCGLFVPHKSAAAVGAPA